MTSLALRLWAPLTFCILAAAPQLARATSELDRKYAFDTIGFIRSWDNSDGLFADYVSEAYRDFFAGQNRFLLRDLSREDNVLSRSKVDYLKLIDDPKILAQVARAGKVESLIRTKIIKDGPKYRFTLEWMQTPQMELIASEHFEIDEKGDPPALGNVKSAMQAGLARLLAHLPFAGHVTGRDGDSVTVNIGSVAGLHPGDTLVVSTIDDVRKHPLLHAIVDWRMSRIGTLSVESVEEAIAFCKVEEEDSRKPIGRHQKITLVIPKQENQNPTPRGRAAEGAPPTAEDQSASELPRNGWVGAGLGLGVADRDYGGGTTGGVTGGGAYFGGSGQGQLWLNSVFFADLGFDYGIWNHSQKITATQQSTPAGSVGGSRSAYSLSLAYSFLSRQDYFSPRGYVRLGYRSTRWELPASTAELTAPITVHDFYVGVGGLLPIRSKFVAELNLDFGLLNGASEAGLGNPSSNSSSDFTLSAAMLYRFSPNVSLRMMLQFISQSADFADGTTISQKLTAISPQILYYF